MKKYNWGIIGAGLVANQFAEDLKLLPGAHLYAIASRSGERAAEFARKHNIPVHYDSWEEISADPDVDIVYVATHNNFHFENTLACLNSGKAVLCEKTFTINKRELEILVNKAREKDVFLMEAMWTRFIPSIQKVIEITKSGELGFLHDIYADFGERTEYDPEHRIYDPVKGGGVLLDLGVYPVFLSLLLAGIPNNIKASARFTEKGVDHSCNMIFDHNNNVVSSLNCTLLADSPVEANLIFENGWIRIESWWLTPGSITIHIPGENPQVMEFSKSGNGYQYEAAEVMRCLDGGLTESPLLPLNFSLDLMGTLDRIREICGIRYKQDNQ
jgi:predicted dehydrogenase